MDFPTNLFEAEADVENEESQQSVENTETEPPTSSGKVDQGLLIEAIQGYPYLFDLSQKLYKDNKKKMLAWQHIAEVVNCTVEDCIKAWRNLRDRFVKERNKLASGAGAPETNWPYYELMLFYGKFSKPRKVSLRTHTATKNEGSRPQIRLASESRPSSSASAWSSYKTIMSPPECVVITDSVPSEEDNEAPGPSKNTPGVGGSGGTPISSCGHAKKRKRLVAQEDNEDVGKLVGVANSIMEKLATRVPKNVNSTFTDYVYQELEKLTQQKAKNKRKQILELLFDDDDD